MDIEIDFHKKLGQGRQGKVFPIKKYNGIGRNDLIVKQYFDQTQAGRLRTFVNHINIHKLHFEPILECLPIKFYRNGKNIGVVMKKAEGMSLENCYKSISQEPLSLRLRYCRDIARGVRRLHESGIIHGDISDVNIIKNKKMIRLIDVDGGGIVPEMIKPTIRGHGGGSWIAPEVFFNQKDLPDIHADEWSLAVLIHTILVPGVDPLYYLEKYAEVEKIREWPVKIKKTKCVDISEIQLSYLKSCEPLFPLLKITFNQGRKFPMKRISAVQFERTIEFCIQHIIKCPDCQEEIVPIHTYACPFCGIHLIESTLKIA